MLRAETVCLSGNDRNLYLVISGEWCHNPIPNKRTRARAHTSTHTFLHASITHTSVASQLEFVCTLGRNFLVRPMSKTSRHPANTTSTSL